MPVDPTFGLLVRRFRNSQLSDGGWEYYFKTSAEGATARPAMTAIALLGLAIGHALSIKNEQAEAKAKGKDVAAKPDIDQQVVNGFVSLGTRVGEATGRTVDRPAVKDVGGLYQLWTMERVAVLYELPDVANKDWYRWGAEILLCHQQPDGGWLDGGYHGQHPVVNTCMALMFLRRANLTQDLSKRLLIDPVLLARQVAKQSPAKTGLKPAAPPPAEPEETAVAPAPREIPEKAEPAATVAAAATRRGPGPGRPGGARLAAAADPRRPAGGRRGDRPGVLPAARERGRGEAQEEEKAFGGGKVIRRGGRYTTSSQLVSPKRHQGLQRL